MTRAFIYCRVSTKDQEDKGGYPRQLEACQRYADIAQLEIVDIYQEDISGMIPYTDRPKLFELVSRMVDGEATVLLVEGPDRVARDDPPRWALIGVLDGHGFEAIDASGNSSVTDNGRLMWGIVGSLGTRARRDLLKRMTQGKYSRVKEGKVLGSLTPAYGYNFNSEERMLDVDEALAEVVFFIYTRYASGEASLNGLCRELQEKGYLTAADLNPNLKKKLVRGKWSNATVRQIIKNPAYKGRWGYGKNSKVNEPVYVSVPPIVTEELWQQANDRLELNKKNKPAAASYPLKGRVRCDKCGYSCRRKLGGRGHTYYGCYNENCDRKSTKAPPLEHSVASWVLDLASSPEQLLQELETQREEAAKDNAPIQAKLDKVQSNLAKERNALSKFADAFAYGTLTDNQLQEKTVQVQARISLLEEKESLLMVELGPPAEFDDEDFEKSWWIIFDELHKQLNGEWLDEDPIAPVLDEALMKIYAQLELAVLLGESSAELSCSISDSKGVVVSLVSS